MNNESIVAARKAAELAVQDMASGPLKAAAFQAILTHLLQREHSVAEPETLATQGAETSAKKKTTPGQRAHGTASRLLTLIEEKVFNQQRSLADVRRILSERGWHYRLEDLGTPVTRLVQRKYLRRTKVADGVGVKKIWKYSNY